MKPVEEGGRAANALRVGALYFAIVFAVGFLLGAIRVTFIVPATGELFATLLELPWILCASWLVCRWAVLRFNVPDAAGPRLLMGGSAFVLLMLAEFILAVLLFGSSPAQFFAKLTDVAGLFGLAGQVVFALMPILVGSRRR